MISITPSNDAVFLRVANERVRGNFSTIDGQPLCGPEYLMPYGAAAKAIFVKANGLPAYNLAMLPGSSDD